MVYFYVFLYFKKKTLYRKLLSVNTVSGLSNPFSCQLNRSEIENFGWFLAVCDVFVRNSDGETALAWRPSIVTVMIDVHTWIDGADLSISTSQIELSISIGGFVVEFCVDQNILIIHLDLHILRRSIITDQSSFHRDRLSESNCIRT